MLFQNQYTILKKANDLSMETLNADNRATVKDICDRLRGMTWNQYEIERIRKDLIDISARCELKAEPCRKRSAGTRMCFCWSWHLICPGARHWTTFASGIPVFSCI